VLCAAWLAAGGAAARAADEAPTLPDRVSLAQKPGEQVPLDARFRDEAGRTVALGDFVRDRPVVLVPAYYRCPMLCTLVITALVDAVADVGLRPGVDFDVVVFSIDPREQPGLAAEKKLRYLKRFGSNETQAGWHFLTGDEADIRRVTGALGYGYVYDAEHDQYAHPAAIAVLTSEGRIGRYLLGIKYPARDLRFALMETAGGKIGSVIDQVLLRCYVYDPQRGGYGFAVITAVRLGGIATMAGVAALVVVVGRRRRKREAFAMEMMKA
jgi:protein SCO1/2